MGDQGREFLFLDPCSFGYIIDSPMALTAS